MANEPKTWFSTPNVRVSGPKGGTELSKATSNGEVEPPRRGARLEPRVHTFFPHPRRHYRLSRTLQRLLDVVISGRNYWTSGIALPLPDFTTMYSISSIPSSTPADAIPRIGSSVGVGTKFP